MAYFYKKDGEIFIPEKINPDLAKLAFAIVKTCKLSFKLQMKTTSLNNTLKAGKTEQMHDIMQKCFEKYRKLYNQDMSLAEIAEELGLLGVVKDDEVLAAVKQAIDENPKAVQDYLDGQKASLNFLVGQVMRLTRGKADPGETVKLLRENKQAVKTKNDNKSKQ